MPSRATARARKTKPTPPSWRAARSRCRTICKRQVLGLRLNAEDRAALQFLIESLNDDGYLEDSLEELARSLAGEDAEQIEALLEHFELALRLLQSLEPAGVGARNLSECLRLQLRSLQDTAARGQGGTASPRCWRWRCAWSSSRRSCWPGAT